MARTVTKGEDGFYRVSGAPEGEYFSDEETAKRVAANRDSADEQASAEEAAAAACSDDGSGHPTTE